jgi:hypothetical protein
VEAAVTLTILRTATGDEGTQSKVTLDGGGAWLGLELPWRDNHVGLSCIPAGEYKAALLYSPDFARPLYHVLAVPGRTSILIHPGNWAGDVMKGLKSDVKGCILLGHSFGTLAVSGPTGQLALIASGMAVSEFMAVARGEPLDVVVTWAEGVNPGVAT